MKSSDDQPIETLRLSDRDKAKLLWAIEESNTVSVDETKRRLRVMCSKNEAVLTLLGDNGSRTRFSVIGRDLSRWGASVIHGRYVYPATRCELMVKSLDDAWHTRLGEVYHVQHIQGMIHNIGVQFEEPIDLSEFVNLSPDEETRHLQELAEDMPDGDDDAIVQVANRVLVVDDFASDRKLFSYWLTRAGMDVTSVGDPKSAREHVEEGEYHLLIVDGRLGEESGPELIKQLRNSQFVAPIIGVSASDDGEAEHNALSAGANCFLCKPFTSDQLVERAFGLLGLDVNGNTEPIYSTFNNDDEMRPLLTAFTRSLPSYIEQLHSANSKNDYELLDEVARTLKGAGSGYGLEDITSHAGEVQIALNDTEADMNKIRETVNQLISILNRVKL